MRILVVEDEVNLNDIIVKKIKTGTLWGRFMF